MKLRNLSLAALVLAALIVLIALVFASARENLLDSTAADGNTGNGVSNDSEPGFTAISKTVEVGVVESLVLNDAKRQKNLDMRISYPKAEAGTSTKYPVVIFSHDAGGSKDGNAKLCDYLASFGYFVVQPTHADSVSLVPKWKRARRMAELLGEIKTDESAWIDRAKDISFIIDSLPEIGRKVPELKGRMDTTRIGMAGHSFGAYTTQLIGGAVIYTKNSPGGESFGDSRVKALLMLSPQGKNQMGLDEGSWNSFTLPAMFITGSFDQGLGGQDVEWRRDSFDRSPPGDKYYVFLKGAFHTSFTGSLVNGKGEMLRFRELDAFHQWSVGKSAERLRDYGETDQAAVFGATKVLALAFFETYLKKNGEAQRFLADREIEKMYGGVAAEETK